MSGAAGTLLPSEGRCLWPELPFDTASASPEPVLFETRCVSKHPACHFAEKPRVFRAVLAGRRCAAASRSAFFNGRTFWHAACLPCLCSVMALQRCGIAVLCRIAAPAALPSRAPGLRDKRL